MEAEEWVSTLEDILEGRGHAVRAMAGYDLIAGDGKLSRLRTDLLERAEGIIPFLRARDAIEAGAPGLISDALTVPNCEAWLEDAKAFGRSYDEDLDLWIPERRCEEAINLIADLDDAEVVSRVARAFGQTDTDLEADLAKCLAWLGKHANLFLPASVWVQAVAMGLRPSLRSHPILGRTAEKFAVLLDAFLAAEKELRFEG